MTSDRAYRAAMTTERAIQQLVLGKDSQFEAPLVDAFLAVLERETEPYQRGLLADFSIEAVRHRVLSADDDAAPGHTWGKAVA